MAVGVRRYDTARIARWQMSKDLMEATGRRHRASICSNKVLRSKLRQFFLKFFIVNSWKRARGYVKAPIKTGGMTYQNDEKDLRNMTEYIVGGVKLACYCLNDRLLLRVI